MLPLSKYRTFTRCKFIASFKIRVKEKEQNSANVPIRCYELLGSFSFLFSFFPFLPFSPSFPLLVLVLQYVLSSAFLFL